MTNWPKDNQEARNAFYGDPGKGEIEKQLVDVIPPFKMTYRDEVKDSSGKVHVKIVPVTKISFHRKCAPALAAALNEIWDYCQHDQAKIDAAGVSDFAGGYNHRMVRGSETKWSNHAYGAAIDLNADENGLFARGNMPQFVIDAFCRQGWMWGGWYSGRTDPMHFEAVDNGGRQPNNPAPVFGAAARPSIELTPAAVKMRMGKAITLAEARRDARGNLAVYALPANDGGGTYEVAGINDRYHPVEAAKLKAMIESGRYLEAEDFVGQFTAAYTDVADLWTSSWGIKFYLRSCVFQRGPTGAACILQLALKYLGEDIGTDGRKANGVDGEVGPLTTAALRRQESHVEQMFTALRAAREEYERTGYQYIDGGPHRDESNSLWRGLINRFNNDLTIARQFQAEQQKGTTPMPDPQPPGQTLPPDTVTPYNASIEDCIIELAKAQRPILERFLKAPSAMTDEEKRRLVIMALGGTPPPSSPVVLLPGTTAPSAGTATPAPDPAAASPTSVNIKAAIAGVIASLGLSATGYIGAPVGPDATMTGMLLPLLSVGAGALGLPAPVVSIISTLFGKLLAPTPPTPPKA